jgi:alanine-glyoxylate transaminase/serine-glyoxylate transaminase/serine-pyruvate transaminase
MNYWGGSRTYHHTAPINMNYALFEALRIVAEEGLDARWKQHQQVAEKLWEGLEDMGLKCWVAKEYRLPSLTTVTIPEGVNGKEVQRRLLDEFNIEIAGGLGELGGKVWRIGMMGYNAKEENVMMLLSALKMTLKK